MPITVVSTPSKAAINVSANAPDTIAKPAADSADANADFASLLLGQIMPLAPQGLAVTDTSTRATKDLDVELTGDETALFATLGLIAAQDTRNVTPTTETASALTAISGQSVPEANSRGTASLDAEVLDGKLAAEDSSGKTAKLAGLQATPDNKSAIIAAAADRSAPLAESAVKRGGVTEAVNSTLPPAIPREVPMTTAAPLTVSTPVQSSTWAADLADKVVWMAGNDKQSAKLTLNPAHLGPLEISLNIDKGHATASFVSASAEVRDALETALPRLREMFANAGISLGQTNVGAESFSQQANANLQNGAQSGSAARWLTDGAILAGDFSGAMPVSSFIAQRGNGMVDTFA